MQFEGASATKRRFFGSNALSDNPESSALSDSNANIRRIGARGALAIVAGSMLGVGIFLSPVQMAALVTNPLAFIGVWFFAAIIVIGGAGAYAELATRYPRAGGDYIFIREVFGSSAAFASGWALVAGIFGGSIAAVAVALCQYQLSTLTGTDLVALHPIEGVPLSAAQLIAIAFVVVLTALNARGVTLSEGVQKLCTLVPIGLLTVLAAYGLVFVAQQKATPTPAVTEQPITLSALVAAYLLAYFAYSGWNAVTYVAGEVKEPSRSIPSALIGGAGVVALLYMVLCVVFMLVLGMGGLAQSGEAGSSLAGALFGSSAGTAMNFVVLLGLTATLNASILGGGRVAYAMAKDGAFLKRAAVLNEKTNSPAAALWIQGAWAVLLIVTNSFDQLLAAVSLTMLCTGSLTVLAFFVVRLRERNKSTAPGVWKAFGFPVLPSLYLISSAVALAVEVTRAIQEPDSGGIPLIGLAIVVFAFIGHASFQRIKSKTSSKS